MRSVTTVEPEWGDDDRAWAIALLQVEADTCGGCGQPLSETTADEAEGAYKVPPPTRCHSCTALHRAQEKYEDAPSGLMFETTRERG